MNTTIGQLVATLFDAYDRSLRDEELAAVATQVRLSELLGGAGRTRRTKRTRLAQRA